MADIVVRDLKKSDISGIIERIEKVSFQDFWNEKLILEELEKDIAYYLVATIDDIIIGYAGYWKIIDEADIMRIAIAPEYRGMGYGRQLFSAMVMHAKNNGIKDMTLEVRADNKPAIGLYKSFGFIEEGTRNNYYQGEQDAILMWLYDI